VHSKKGEHNITTPRRTTEEESKYRAKKLRKEKELERKAESRQEYDSRHAPIG